jgi:protein TonB
MTAATLGLYDEGRGRDWVRWSLAAAVMLAAHVGVVEGYLAWHRTPSLDLPSAPEINVEFAPESESVADAPMSEVTPRQPLDPTQPVDPVPQELVPAPPPQQLALLPPPPDAVPPPIEARPQVEPQPALDVLRPPETPQPELPPVPAAPPERTAFAIEVPPPVEARPVETTPVEPLPDKAPPPRPAPTPEAKKKPPEAPAPPRRVAALPPPRQPSPAASAASSEAVNGWRLGVMAALSRVKRYPEAANHQGGTVQVSFSVDRNGRALSRRIVSSSGVPALDQEVLAMLDRAQFPAFVAGMAQAYVPFTVPIRFTPR